MCYWCEEKFFSGHQCKNKQLFRVKAYKGQYSSSNNSETDENPTVLAPALEEDEAPIISLNAVARTLALCGYKTMRVSGQIKGQKIYILVDSGSTHNFTNTYIIGRFGNEGVSTINSHVMVVVVDGNKIQCDNICTRLKWRT